MESVTGIGRLLREPVLYNTPILIHVHVHASCINLRLTGCTRAASQPARAAGQSPAGSWPDFIFDFWGTQSRHDMAPIAACAWRRAELWYEISYIISREPKGIHVHVVHVHVHVHMYRY